MAAVLIAHSVAVAWASAPQGEAIRTAEDMDVDLSDRVEPLPRRARPGEWLEYSRILPLLIGLLTLGWLVNQFVTLPFLSVISSLNPVTKAVPTTAGVLVQFPLYAAMAAPSPW